MQMAVFPVPMHRRAYADLVKRLQVAEVEAERTRRARWEAALHAWRTLRSLHAMSLFNERIRCARSGYVGLPGRAQGS